MNRSLLCLSLIACFGAANAQNEQENARKMATALFARADSLVNAGKYAAFLNMFAPGYYSVDLQGKRMTYGQLKHDVMGMSKMARSIHSTTTVKNVQLMNDEEVVWTEQKVQYSIKRNGRWVSMIETTRWAENLKMVDGQWKFASSQQLMTNEPWSFKTNN